MIALYRPGRSPLHRAPAGVKLLGLAVLALAVSLYPHDPLSVAVTLVGVLALYALAALPPRVWLEQLWLLKWVVLMLVATQLIFLGPLAATVNTGRVLCVLLLAALLTLTTRAEDMLDALQIALRPLRRIGVDPWRVGLTLSLTLALVPVVAGFARRVREAQRARGVRLGPRAVMPLLVMSLRHADDTGDALSARGL